VTTWKYDGVEVDFEGAKMKTLADGEPKYLTEKDHILLFCVLEAIFLFAFFIGKDEGVGFFDSLSVNGIALTLAVFGQLSVIVIVHLFCAWYNSTERLTIERDTGARQSEIKEVDGELAKLEKEKRMEARRADGRLRLEQRRERIAAAKVVTADAKAKGVEAFEPSPEQQKS
jgi:hypothetical protein